MAKRFIACVLLIVSLAAAESLRAAEDPLKNPSPEYVTALREAVRAFNGRDFDKALKALDTAETIYPPNALTLNTRGAALIEQKRYDEGAGFCRKALEIDPKFYPARFNLCEVPLVQKHYAEARSMFMKLHDENPKDELVQFRILLTWLLEKNDGEARRVLDSIPFPSNTPAYYYGNAAWEFAHGNAVEGNKWVMRGNWVFKPEVTTNFSQPFLEIGWLKTAPGTSATLPEMAEPGANSPAKLEFGKPAPAPPLEPAK